MPGPCAPGVRLAVSSAFWIRTVCVSFLFSCELDVTRANHVTKKSGPGVGRRSATGHLFRTTGNTTIWRTRDGINVAGDLQIAPKKTGLQRSIMSVGKVRDRGSITTFRSKILNEFPVSRIELDRAGGVYRLRADASAKKTSGRC